MFVVLLCIYLGVKFLVSHFEGLPNCFPKFQNFTFPPAMNEGLPFLHTLDITCYCLICLIVVVLMGVVSHNLLVVLIFLMTDFSIFPCAYQLFVYHFWINVYSHDLSIVTGLLFLLSYNSSLYIPHMKSFMSQMYHL